MNCVLCRTRTEEVIALRARVKTLEAENQRHKNAERLREMETVFVHPKRDFLRMDFAEFEKQVLAQTAKACAMPEAFGIGPRRSPPPPSCW